MLILTGCGDGPDVKADVTPPSVTLSVSPATVTGAGSVKLSATATDNVGVTKVVFYRGSETTPLYTDTAAPFEATDTLTSGNAASTATYRAVAYDAAGNTKEATTTVALQPAVLGLPRMTVPGVTSGTVTLIGFHSTQNVKQVLTQGKINSDSTVTIPDPTEASLAPILSVLPGRPDSCTGSFIVSDPKVMVAVRNYLLLNATAGADNVYNGSYLYLRNPDGSEPQMHTAYASGYPNQLWYADRATTVTADVTCTYDVGSTKTVLNLNLKKGWNYVQQNYTDGEPALNSFKTLEAPAISLGTTEYQISL